MTDITAALDRLAGIIGEYTHMAVAFSGGVDSTLLAVMAHRTLPGRAMALSARTPLMADREKAAAGQLAGRLGLVHQWVDVDLLADPDVTANPPRRCYYCKRRLLGTLAATAITLEMAPLVHGANTDDDGDFRPGQAAARELNVPAPLAMAGMDKADVRRAARHLGLPNWDKPAMACLASRIPYGTVLSAALLNRVAQAEAAVLDAGVTTCRVRVHGAVARIEAPVTDFDTLTRPTVRNELVARLRQLGFDHVSLDMEGLVSGSMNRSMPTDTGAPADG